MRLLHVIRSTDPETGGPIEGVLRSAEVMLREGHQVEAVSLESPEDVARRKTPIPVTALGKGVGRYGFNPRLAPWLRRERHKYDAVISHGLWNYSSVGTWLGLRGGPTPYYIFIHGMMDPWFREAYPLKHAAKQIFWALFEGRVLRDAKMVLFTAEEEMIRARDVFFGHAYRGQVVGYGTTVPDGHPESEQSAFYSAFPELRSRRILLFLSRIHPKKSCDLLIRAFAKCIRQLPSNLDLVIAGPDQVGWLNELRELAASLGIADRCHWPGMLNGDLKWGAFRCADAMILPSHQENFGIVVAEAMACGTPVLVSDKVNIWREVEACKAGFAAPDTVEGIYSLILEYFALSTDARAEMSNAAREGFREYFDFRKTALDLAKMIDLTRREPAASAQAGIV
jgi:glycosyltransferase involved in cell wall biosynthesis